MERRKKCGVRLDVLGHADSTLSEVQEFVVKHIDHLFAYLFSPRLLSLAYGLYSLGSERNKKRWAPFADAGKAAMFGGPQKKGQ